MYPDNMVEVHVRAYLYRWQAKDVIETQGLHYQVALFPTAVSCRWQQCLAEGSWPV